MVSSLVTVDKVRHKSIFTIIESPRLAILGIAACQNLRYSAGETLGVVRAGRNYRARVCIANEVASVGSHWTMNRDAVQNVRMECNLVATIR